MQLRVRIVSRLLILTLAGNASGCVVSKAKYDEAVLRADDEAQRSADLKRQLADLKQKADATSEELARLRAEWERSQGELQKKQLDVDDRDKTLAELSHEYQQGQREHDEAKAMVEQLREELARVATHIAELSEQRKALDEEKAELSAQLERDAAKLRVLEEGLRGRALVVRDLTLALSGPLEKEVIRLDLRGDRVLVWTRSSSIFTRGSSKLTSDGKSLVGKLGKALAPGTDLVDVVERGPVEKVGLRAQRLRAVGEQLSEAGLDLGRVRLELPSADETVSQGEESGKSPQLIFSIRPAPEKEQSLAEVNAATAFAHH